MLSTPLIVWRVLRTKPLFWMQYFHAVNVENALEQCIDFDQLSFQAGNSKVEIICREYFEDMYILLIVVLVTTDHHILNVLGFTSYRRLNKCCDFLW